MKSFQAMRVSVRTLFIMVMFVGLAIGLWIANNRPPLYVIRSNGGHLYYEFEDSIFSLESHVASDADLLPTDFADVHSQAETICAELESVRDETGFYNWEIDGATYENLRFAGGERHGYSFQLLGSEYPPHLGINNCTELELFFVSRRIVVYSTRGVASSVVPYLPKYDILRNATPKVEPKLTCGIH